MVDFDAEERADSGGTLLLDISGTEVPIAVVNGKATLALELHASVTLVQVPPYFCDARMSPVRIEVTA